MHTYAGAGAALLPRGALLWPVVQDAAMRVRVPGCGDAFGSGGRWQTCNHLAADGQAMLRLGPAVVQGWEVEHACGAPALALRVEFGAATSPPDRDPGGADGAYSHVHRHAQQTLRW